MVHSWKLVGGGKVSIEHSKHAVMRGITSRTCREGELAAKAAAS
jgi:hypothetical protein